MAYFTWLTGLSVLVYLIGLAVCVWAYRADRKAGYLVVATYFVFAVCASTVLPWVNTARSRAWQAQQPRSTEADDAYMKDLMALQEKYYPPSGSRRAALPQRLNIRFPFGSILLVAGLWLVARREPRKEAEPIGSANAASPRR